MVKKAKDYIIFALDVASAGEALEFARLLSEYVGIFKIGLELFVAEGPGIVADVADVSGKPVFLDLKLHDIPATVGRAAACMESLGVAFTTVHCGENPAALSAAVSRVRNTRILAVTLLTSTGKENLVQSGFDGKYVSDPASLVLLRARLALQAGCHGVICSGHEVRKIKESLGRDFLAVVPGIRPGWESIADDQKRVVTPAEAVAGGADYLVVGRPIRDAPDPVEAAGRIAQEIASVLG